MFERSAAWLRRMTAKRQPSRPIVSEESLPHTHADGTTHTHDHGHTHAHADGVVHTHAHGHADPDHVHEHEPGGVPHTH